MNAKLLLTLTVMLLIISSCTSSHINAKRVNQDAFPPEFNKCKECTLIVLKRTGGVNPRGINNYLAKSFRKHYKGKFEMATPEEVDTNPKYQDKNKYRFIVSDQVRTGGSKVDNQKISNGMVTGHTIDYNYTSRWIFAFMTGWQIKATGLWVLVPMCLQKRLTERQYYSIKNCLSECGFSLPDGYKGSRISAET
jgi:hypothetical protein